MKHTRRGFTLVELLVVIAIISLVALCVSRAVRGAVRQAHATKCMANMKNLHSAVMSYVADKERYPYAASWEWYDKQVFSKGAKAEKRFYERRGWVGWVKNNGSDESDYPWNKPANGPYASKYHYPASTSPDMVAGITNGTLFKYVGRDMSTYVCPGHTKDQTGKQIFLSYSMNSFFRWGREEVSGVHPTLLISDAGPERWQHKAEARRKHKDPKTGEYWEEDERSVGVDASRMALFIELAEDGPCAESDNKERKGINGDDYSWAYYKNSNGVKSYAIRIPDFYPDDCVWDWTDEYRDWPKECHEVGRGWYDAKKKASRANHFKSGPCAHVVYLDGHVGAIRVVASEGGDVDVIYDDLHNPRKAKKDE